jgi:tRNA pseudouridine32 synthase/23S rRNA pseudouridine746 synthase
MIVHRLDYATSGVVIFARNLESLKELHDQFRQRDKVHKVYSAVVSGRMDSFEGEIELPLGKDIERGPPFCRVTAPIGGDPGEAVNKYSRGKYSLTHWRLHQLGNDSSLLLLTPKTGRYSLSLSLTLLANYSN